MPGGARLAGFAAALAAIFGLALLAGGALDPSAPGGEERETGHGAMSTTTGGHAAMAPAAPRGLAVTEDGLRLDVRTPQLRRDAARTLRFRILGRDGEPVRAFGVSHTKRMHVIVVRRDLTRFEHLHPRMAPDGTWSVPLRLAAAGSYRVYADFVRPDDTPVTLASDLRVAGDAALADLPAPAATADSGAYRVRLAGGAPAGRVGTLRFTITRDGRTITPQPYLGAGGHLVVLREGDLAFLHVHPEEHGGHSDDVAFETTLPSAGRYRLFLQFRDRGTVHTVAFTREAA